MCTGVRSRAVSKTEHLCIILLVHDAAVPDGAGEYDTVERVRPLPPNETLSRKRNHMNVGGFRYDRRARLQPSLQHHHHQISPQSVQTALPYIGD